MGKMMERYRVTEIVQMFDYVDKYKVEDIVQIQVPSVYFPTKGSVVDALDEALKQGLLQYDNTTKLFSKA